MDPTVTGKQGAFIVEVSNPSKVGEGMSAHIVYEVHFKGVAPPFEGQESSVSRRFSDFLGLHAKLCEKHLFNGIIIPPAPEKDVLGTTKVKMSKDATLESEFVERRRIALMRFLYRILSHPVLRDDEDLRAFLTQQGDLPRATNTQLLSGASAKKMFRNFGDAIGKIAYKMDDPEEYFELKAEELENWERQLKRLHGALASLVTSDQDLSNAKFLVSRAISQLANVEENTGLAQALSRLAETEEEVSHKHAVQSEAELVRLVECARETLGLIQGCKDVLGERVKVFRNWKAAEAALRSKREQKVRLELAGKNDQRKITTMDAEIEEVRSRVNLEEENFKKISKTIKEEFDRFDMTRFADFKRAATEFLEVMLETQSRVIVNHFCVFLLAVRLTFITLEFHLDII
ncbi:Sorting nexin [Fasciolopsis buskii]|uniref:Sorting nexin n=1 Tax=Fasciolopsis buskii TaxID=27845 RepID=A0A8E0RYD7_9TREM|nr:Sorting nexin [Fasciolopsis buski]